VKETRDYSGRMPYRLWYEENEIDSLMEAELRRALASPESKAARQWTSTLSSRTTCVFPRSS